jgi:hypothetical protein
MAITNKNMLHHGSMMDAFKQAEATTIRPEGMGAKYGFGSTGKPLSDAQRASVLKAGRTSALKRGARAGKALTRVKTSFLE